RPLSRGPTPSPPRSGRPRKPAPAERAAPLPPALERSLRKVCSTPDPSLFSRVDVDEAWILLVDPDPARRDQADRLGEQSVLGRVNRLLGLVPIAARSNWHRPLHDDRPRVHPFVHEVDGQPSDLRAVVDRLPN